MSRPSWPPRIEVLAAVDAGMARLSGASRPLSLTDLDGADHVRTQGKGRSPAAPRTRWAASFADVGRTFELLPAADPPPQPAVSATAVDHVLDVLLDNALAHGEGKVTVRVDKFEGAARLTVGDRGQLDGDPSQLFARRAPEADGSGIGLHLGRTLVEAEGGRLRPTNLAPTTFEIAMSVAI